MMNSRKIAYYKSIRDIASYRIITVEQAYTIIQNGKLEAITDNILTEHKEGILEGWKTIDKHQYKKDKANKLPVVTFSTSVSRRKENTVTPESHTGIINLDLDENEKDILDSFFHNIIPHLPYVEACGLSVSGKLTGYRWVNVLIEIPDLYEQLPEDLLQVIPKVNWLDELHKLYHQHITELFASQYGITVGEAKDLKRNRTLCHDPQLYVNEKAIPIKITDIVFSEQELKKVSYDSTKETYKGESNPQSIMDWIIEQEGKPIPGSRTLKFVRYFGICNSRGILKEEAIEIAKQYGGEYQKIGEYVYSTYSSQFNSVHSLSLIHI